MHDNFHTDETPESYKNNIQFFTEKNSSMELKENTGNEIVTEIFLSIYMTNFSLQGRCKTKNNTRYLYNITKLFRRNIIPSREHASKILAKYKMLLLWYF